MKHNWIKWASNELRAAQMCNFLGSVAMHQPALHLAEAWRCCGIVLTGLCRWGASFYPAPASTSRGQSWAQSWAAHQPLHVLLISLRREEGKCLLLGKETGLGASREPAMSAGHGAPCLAVLTEQKHSGEGVGSGPCSARPTRLSLVSQVTASRSTHLLPAGQKETPLPQMEPVGNISIPTGSRSMISILTAFGFSPSCRCRCSGSTWALVCGSCGEGSGSSQARGFQDASGGPCCPAHPSSGRVSSVWCCITKTHHSLPYQAALICKAGLAPRFMMLKNSNTLSL